MMIGSDLVHALLGVKRWKKRWQVERSDDDDNNGVVITICRRRVISSPILDRIEVGRIVGWSAVKVSLLIDCLVNAFQF